MFSAASYIPVLDINVSFWLRRWRVISKGHGNQKRRVVVWALLLTPCIAMSKLQHLSFPFCKTESNKLHNHLRVPTTGLVDLWKQFHLSENFSILKPCSVSALRSSLWDNQNMHKWKQYLILPRLRDSWNMHLFQPLQCEYQHVEGLKHCLCCERTRIVLMSSSTARRA